MKKFFVPLFLLLLLSCSSEGFKSDIAASAQKNVNCCVRVDGKYIQKTISENLCTEVGFPIEKCLDEVNSSSSDEVSSSSRPSSSSQGSSSSRPGSSSSVGSSSSGADSSSSGDDDSSSSVGGSSSSSVGAVSSSSVGAGSSSSIGNSSSSSIGISSSSSAPPSLTCSTNPFPYYVAKTKKESVKNLFSNNGCGNVTYTIQSGGTAAGATISGDSISFATASTTERPITIRATAASQCGTKDCQIAVVIADDYRDARCNHKDVFKVNLTTIKSATTVIEYACCESKTDYLLTCADVSYNLKVKSNSTPVGSSGGNANLPNLTPIQEVNALCDVNVDGYPDPRGFLYRYPERILMTVTNTIPSGGFTCNSW